MVQQIRAFLDCHYKIFLFCSKIMTLLQVFLVSSSKEC